MPALAGHGIRVLLLAVGTGAVIAAPAAAFVHVGVAESHEVCVLADQP